MRVTGADQAEYNGDFIVISTTSTTITFTVPGTPATPATGTIRGGYSGGFGGRELLSLTSSAGVATAVCPGHGLTTGQVWYPAGVDDTASGGSIVGSYRGGKTITRVDADTISFPVSGTPTTPATTAPGNGGSRIWMFPDRTMTAGFAALNAMISGPGSGAFPQLMAAFMAKYITPNGLKIAGYESGQHLASSAGAAAAAFYFELNRDPRMGDCYLSYYPMLDGIGFILANHYKSIGGTGAGNQFGVLEYQGQIPAAKQIALNTLLAAAYYNPPLGGGSAASLTVTVGRPRLRDHAHPDLRRRRHDHDLADDDRPRWHIRRRVHVGGGGHDRHRRPLPHRHRVRRPSGRDPDDDRGGPPRRRLIRGASPARTRPRPTHWSMHRADLSQHRPAGRTQGRHRGEPDRCVPRALYDGRGLSARDDQP